MGKIILGSSSPRRADILKKLQLDFEIIPSSYVEPHDQTDFSYAYVENLAYNKALYVAKELHPERHLVLGADTIVVIDNKIPHFHHLKIGISPQRRLPADMLP